MPIRKQSIIRFLLVPPLFVVTAFGWDDPKPTIHRLTPAASQRLDQLKAAEVELQKQWGVIQAQKEALFIGADVPVEAREHCVADKGVYVCAVPVTAESDPPK